MIGDLVPKLESSKIINAAHQIRLYFQVKPRVSTQILDYSRKKNHANQRTLAIHLSSTISNVSLSVHLSSSRGDKKPKSQEKALLFLEWEYISSVGYGRALLWNLKRLGMMANSTAFSLTAGPWVVNHMIWINFSSYKCRTLIYHAGLFCKRFKSTHIIYYHSLLVIWLLFQ